MDACVCGSRGGRVHGTLCAPLEGREEHQFSAREGLARTGGALQLVALVVLRDVGTHGGTAGPLSI